MENTIDKINKLAPFEHTFCTERVAFCIFYPFFELSRAFSVVKKQTA